MREFWEHLLALGQGMHLEIRSCLRHWLDIRDLQLLWFDKRSASVVNRSRAWMACGFAQTLTFSVTVSSGCLELLQAAS